MQNLLNELKHLLVERLGLTDVRPEDIGDDMPLVEEGLGLDSIDVLELVVVLEREYGVRVESKETGRKAFASIRAMAEFIGTHRPQPTT